MPREIALISDREPTYADLAVAASAVEPEARVVSVGKGMFTEVVDPASGLRLVQVMKPVYLHNPVEVTRLLPDVPEPTGPIWWTDVYASWDERGDRGSRIALRFAAQLSARWTGTPAS